MTEEKDLTLAEQNAQRVERLGRVQAVEAAEKKTQADREARAAEQTAGINERFFLAEAAREEAARNNKPVVLKRNTNEDAIAAEQARYPRPAVNKPAEGYLDAASTVLAPRRASITLTPQTAKYPSSDPRSGLTDELILSFGMQVDPALSPFEK